MKSLTNHVRRGGVLIYSIIAMPVLVGGAILAVDFGRVTVANSEIQAATDSAVRAAGQKMLEGGDIRQIQAAAVGAASQNRVDGQPVIVRSSNVILGVYETDTKTFTPTGNPNLANAIRVQLEHRFGVDGPPLSFAQFASGGVKSVGHRATVMVDSPPPEWTMVKNTITETYTWTDPDTILTEEQIELEYRRYVEEQERLKREADERARLEQEEKDRLWREEQARILAERDAAEAANPQLKVERLEREQREREEYERWLAEEQKKTTTTTTPGQTHTTTITREEEVAMPDPKPKKKVMQVE
jgi:hypothetical protein